MIAGLLQAQVNFFVTPYLFYVAFELLTYVEFLKHIVFKDHASMGIVHNRFIPQICYVIYNKIHLFSHLICRWLQAEKSIQLCRG